MAKPAGQAGRSSGSEMRGDRERALIAAVRADLSDEQPWLVLADYLAERGDPRAELMQLTRALDAALGDEAEVARVEHALAELESRVGRSRLAGPIASFVNNVEFTRGLVSDVSLSWTQLALAGETLFELAPVTALRIDSADESADDARLLAAHDLALARGLSLVERLDLSDDYVGVEPLAALLGSDQLTALRSLHLGDADSSPAAAAVIAGAPLPALEELAFNGWMECSLGDAGAAALAESEGFASLRRLYLRNTRLGPDGAAALAQAEALQGLELLFLGDGRYSRNVVGAAGARAIADGPAFVALRQLDLGYNDIGDEGLLALVQGRSLGALRELSLAANYLSDIVPLSSSPLLGKLDLLDLSHNALTGAAVRALAFQPRIATLRRLSLYHNPIGSDGVDALVSSPHLAALAELNLAQTGLGDADADALLAWPGLDQLRWLHVGLNGLSQARKDALIGRMGSRVRV